MSQPTQDDPGDQATLGVLQRLRASQREDDENLERSYSEFGQYVQYLSAANGDEAESDSPIIDRYLAEQGPESLQLLTNFSRRELDRLWLLVERKLTQVWNTGRGRRPRAKAKDAFMMALCVLKHYEAWHKHAADFGLQTPTFEKMVYKVLQEIEPVLMDAFVAPVEMSQLVQDRTVFNNFKYALYATDVKFQPANRPSGRFLEQKVYFSGKHKLYGYKIEVSVAPNGQAVFFSKPYPGSVSDLSIFIDSTAKHQRLLTKRDDDHSVSDHGEGWSEYPGSWAVLVDKGYQGLQATVRAIHPTKNPRGGALSASDVRRNELVSSDRVIVENYFGRMAGLWKCMRSTFVWSEARYELLTRICIALTNFHLQLFPLRRQDTDKYEQVLARYLSMAETNDSRRKRNVEAARSRREKRARVDAMAPSLMRQLMENSQEF